MRHRGLAMVRCSVSLVKDVLSLLPLLIHLLLWVELSVLVSAVRVCVCFSVTAIYLCFHRISVQLKTYPTWLKKAFH